MKPEQLKDDAPGTLMFPQFESELYLGATREVCGLTPDPVSYTHLTLPTIYSV